MSAKQIKAHCPSCGPDKNAHVLGEKVQPWDNEEAGIWGSETNRMLQCAGCDTVYHQRIAIDSEDERHTAERATYWPAAAKRREPAWFWDLMFEDSKIHSLLEETYKALNVDARVLAAIGLRTVFDRASETLGIDPELSFKQKLNQLLSLGKIGNDEREILDVLTDAGGAAAHRGWTPSVKQLNTLMDIAESFIYRTFILSEEAKKLRKSVPRRDPNSSAP